MAWDDDKRAKAIKLYKDGNPTGANSIELVKAIAETIGETPNGVRMVLSKAEVYIKKEETSTKTTTKTTDGVAKVSKADSIAALVASIKATGYIVDDDIISKLTGKQAVYFTSVIAAAKKIVDTDEIEEIEE